MSKNISISDEVYEQLKREKGERSFSEVIAEKLDDGNRLNDVTGQQIFESGTEELIKDEIRNLSVGTMDRIDDETA